jgi:hypothetical protein
MDRFERNTMKSAGLSVYLFDHVSAGWNGLPVAKQQHASTSSNI